MDFISKVFRFTCFLHLFQIRIDKVYSLMPKNNYSSYLLINKSSNNRTCKIHNKLSNKHLNKNSIIGIDRKSLLTINPGNLSVEGYNDSTVVYFTNLLKNKLKRKRMDYLNYSDHCKNIKDQIVDSYSKSLMEHISNKFPNQSLLLEKGNRNVNLSSSLSQERQRDGYLGESRSEETKLEDHIKVLDVTSEVNNLGKLYESSIFGSALVYLEMTSRNSKSVFASVLSSADREKRLKVLFDLLSYAEAVVFGLFKTNVNNLKFMYINEFFNYVKSHRNESDISKEYSRILSSYKTNLNNLIPIYFKSKVTNNVKEGPFTNNLKHMLNEVIKLKLLESSDLVMAEKVLKGRASLTKNWNVVGEVNEFKVVLDNINTLVSKIRSETDKKTKNTDNLMEVISSQQHKIKEYNKLLQSEKGTCNLAFTYRIPGTNLTISSSLFSGKNNIQLACIPDHYAHFLGPDGFVKSLPCGFLGMDLNITF
nr:hypothetical protein MACL_00001187 [Theileria orientalis]